MTDQQKKAVGESALSTATIEEEWMEKKQGDWERNTYEPGGQKKHRAGGNNRKKKKRK